MIKDEQDSKGMWNARLDHLCRTLGIKKEIVSQVKFKIDTFTTDKIPKELKNIQAVKPGSRNLSK